MSMCSDPTSGAHGGIGCTNEASMCDECHFKLVVSAVVENTNNRIIGEEARYTEYKKDAMLNAIEFANWFIREWKSGSGDAVFYYDRWLKERKNV